MAAGRQVDILDCSHRVHGGRYSRPGKGAFRAIRERVPKAAEARLRARNGFSCYVALIFRGRSQLM